MTNHDFSNQLQLLVVCIRDCENHFLTTMYVAEVINNLIHVSIAERDPQILIFYQTTAIM